MEFVEYPHLSGINSATGFKHSKWLSVILPIWAALQFGIVRTEPRRLTAPCLTLAELLDEHKIDRVNLLKIDCEGGEYGILKAPDALHRVDKVAMEYHELDPAHDHQILVDRLKSDGFEVTIVKPWYHAVVNVGMIWARRPTAS